MASIYKTMVLLATVLFTHSATAVIIEGSFSGRGWDASSYNMELTPDADFWADMSSWGNGFEGTFWYDTDLAEPPVIWEEPGYVLSAAYLGRDDMLHLTLRVNGKEKVFKTGGSITVGNYTNQYGELLEEFSLGFGGFVSFSPYRQPVPFLNGLSLVQNFSRDGHTHEFIEYLGYMEFLDRGYIGGTYYEGLVSGEINKFEIHVRVPEPSSLLLLLCFLPLLIWRYRLSDSAKSISS